MADISMCIAKTDNWECSKKETCYRYKAKANKEWQSFIEPQGDDCDMYWEIKKDVKIHKIISDNDRHCLCGEIRPLSELTRKWEDVTCPKCAKLVPAVSRKRIRQGIIT